MTTPETHATPLDGTLSGRPEWRGTVISIKLSYPERKALALSGADSKEPCWAREWPPAISTGQRAAEARVPGSGPRPGAPGRPGSALGTLHLPGRAIPGEADQPGGNLADSSPRAPILSPGPRTTPLSGRPQHPRHPAADGAAPSFSTGTCWWPLLGSWMAGLRGRKEARRAPPSPAQPGVTTSPPPPGLAKDA